MPSTDPSDENDPSDGTGPTPDDGATALTEREVYDAVHHAVRDALWDVLGTLVLTGFLLVLLGTGIQIVLNSAQAAPGTSLPAVVLGTAIAGLGALGLLRLYDYL